MVGALLAAPDHGRSKQRPYHALLVYLVKDHRLGKALKSEFFPQPPVPCGSKAF